MSATTLSLTVEPGALDARSSWSEFESLAVQMSREVSLRVSEATLAGAQERLIDSVCGPRWVPVRTCRRRSPARAVRWPRTSPARANAPGRRKLHTAAGTVEFRPDRWIVSGAGGTTATAGQAHNALADTAALLTGTDGTLGPGHPTRRW